MAMAGAARRSVTEAEPRRCRIGAGEGTVACNLQPASDNLLPEPPSSTEPEPLELAGCGPRQGGREFDPPGILVRRDARLHERLDVVRDLRRRRDAIAKHDKRLRLREAIAIGDTHNGAFEHRFVRQHGVLDLDRRYPDSTNLQHVVGPATIMVIAVPIAKV